MPSHSSTYISEESTVRGQERYRKTREFWEQAELIVGPVLTLSSCTGLVAVLLNDYVRRPVPEHLVPAATVLCSVSLALGILLYLTAKWNIKHNHVTDANYQLALHFMNEMGIPNPKALLNNDPRYLDAYSQVWTAVLKNKVKSPDADRISSLILRNENSLALAPQLIDLIKENPTMDYTALAEELDNHTPTTK